MNHRQSPDCFKCRHFKITWEVQRPYACQAMGFKSHGMPWQVVIEASGQPCMMFTPKEPNPAGGRVHDPKGK
jgi:hypothetical protein